jgi:pimeloyl-ACP methyl ester carboxylesterase
MKRVLIVLSVFVAICFALPAVAADIGVVFMHGKWGMNDKGPTVGPILDALGRAGILVETPEMPWSKTRAYDRDIAGAMEEIDAAVAKLKARGAQRIVVGGQSMGANAAMIYASQRDGLLGVLAVSPGHTPEQPGFQRALKGDPERAQKMISDGKGDVRDRFNDSNQGKEQKMPATAAIYWSWFDPNGLAVIPRSAARMKPGAALFWIVGENDAMSKRGKGYAFDRAPANPKSVYKVVGGGHFEAGGNAASEIVAWLKTL